MSAYEPRAVTVSCAFCPMQYVIILRGWSEELLGVRTHAEILEWREGAIVEARIAADQLARLHKAARGGHDCYIEEGPARL